MAPGDDLRRQAAHRAAAAVEQAGLTGQRLAVLDHADDVAAAAAQPAGGQHDHVAGVAVDLGDVAAQPARGRAGVELGLDHDPAPDDVQPTGEPQHRRDLGLAVTRLDDGQPAELVLHQGRQRHGPILPPNQGASDASPRLSP